MSRRYFYIISTTVLVAFGGFLSSGGVTQAAQIGIYWTDIATDKIQRADLDGSNIEDLVTSGLVSPQSLSVDIAGGRMYWADFGSGKVQRANYTG